MLQCVYNVYFMHSFCTTEFSIPPFSICSPMEITGDGLMTAQAVGVITVHQIIVPLTQHGGLGRAVSASQLDVEDILCSLTRWYRYVQSLWDLSSL